MINKERQQTPNSRGNMCSNVFTSKSLLYEYCRRCATTTVHSMPELVVQNSRLWGCTRLAITLTSFISIRAGSVVTGLLGGWALRAGKNYFLVHGKVATANQVNFKQSYRGSISVTTQCIEANFCQMNIRFFPKYLLAYCMVLHTLLTSARCGGAYSSLSTDVTGMTQCYVMHCKHGLWSDLWSELYIESIFMRYGHSPGDIRHISIVLLM